jgi:hypothetical protein
MPFTQKLPLIETLKYPFPELATTPLLERVEFHDIVNPFNVPSLSLNGSKGPTDKPSFGTTTSLPVPLPLAEALKVAVWTSSAAPAMDGRHASRVKRWMSFMDLEFAGRF